MAQAVRLSLEPTQLWSTPLQAVLAKCSGHRYLGGAEKKVNLHCTCLYAASDHGILTPAISHHDQQPYRSGRRSQTTLYSSFITTVMERGQEERRHGFVGRGGSLSGIQREGRREGGTALCVGRGGSLSGIQREGRREGGTALCVGRGGSLSGIQREGRREGGTALCVGRGDSLSGIQREGRREGGTALCVGRGGSLSGIQREGRREGGTALCVGRGGSLSGIQREGRREGGTALCVGRGDFSIWYTGVASLTIPHNSGEIPDR